MKQRLFLIALSAGLLAIQLPVSADAGGRFKLRFWEPDTIYEYDEESSPFEPVYRIMGLADDEPGTKYRMRVRDPQFDERYYEPDYVAPKPVRKPSRAVSTTLASPPPVVRKAAPGAQVATATVKSQAAPARSAGSITCDKATEIVTGFGFTAVKPASCTGKSFAFNAQRAGKNYSVKVDATSGELTDVRKLQ